MAQRRQAQLPGQFPDRIHERIGKPLDHRGVGFDPDKTQLMATPDVVQASLAPPGIHQDITAYPAGIPAHGRGYPPVAGHGVAIKNTIHIGDINFLPARAFETPNNRRHRAVKIRPPEIGPDMAVQINDRAGRPGRRRMPLLRAHDNPVARQQGPRAVAQHQPAFPVADLRIMDHAQQARRMRLRHIARIQDALRAQAAARGFQLADADQRAGHGKINIRPIYQAVGQLQGLKPIRRQHKTQAGIFPDHPRQHVHFGVRHGAINGQRRSAEQVERRAQNAAAFKNRPLEGHAGKPPPPGRARHFQRMTVRFEIERGHRQETPAGAPARSQQFRARPGMGTEPGIVGFHQQGIGSAQVSPAGQV